MVGQCNKNMREKKLIAEKAGVINEADNFFMYRYYS